jgi:hypothetical protein
VIDREKCDVNRNSSIDQSLRPITDFAEKVEVKTLDSIGSLAEDSRSLKDIGINSEEQLFYSACEKPVNSGGLDTSEQKQLLRAVEVLQKLSTTSTNLYLEKFIKDFKSRFDQQKVPC